MGSVRLPHHHRGEKHVPLALVHFHQRYAQELVHGLLRVVHFHLLRIIVFVLDPDVAGFVLVRIFVFEVVTTRRQLSLGKEYTERSYSSSPESCMKSSSSDILRRSSDVVPVEREGKLTE